MPTLQSVCDKSQCVYVDKRVSPFVENRVEASLKLQSKQRCKFQVHKLECTANPVAGSEEQISIQLAPEDLGSIPPAGGGLESRALTLPNAQKVQRKTTVHRFQAETIASSAGIRGIPGLRPSDLRAKSPANTNEWIHSTVKHMHSYKTRSDGSEWKRGRRRSNSTFKTGDDYIIRPDYAVQRKIVASPSAGSTRVKSRFRSNALLPEAIRSTKMLDVRFNKLRNRRSLSQSAHRYM